MKFNISVEHKYRTGVYVIRNSVNDKIYVGSAINLRHRFICHRNRLRRNCHKSPQLQSFANRYGIEVFRFEILEFCSAEERLAKEQSYLDALRPFNKNGFNTMKLAGSPKGFRHSEESKIKISLAHKGRKHTPEARKNMRAGQQNRTAWGFSEEGKIKVINTHKGKVLSKETRELISKSNTGKVRSEQARLNMSRAHLGKPLTESQKRNQSLEMLERNPFGKIVLNLETGIYFDSGIQAAKAHGLHAVGLNRKLRGERKNNTQFILA